MKHNTTFLTAFLISLFLCLPATQAATPVANLVFPDTIDLGSVEQGKTLELKFILENTGEKALAIKSLSSDCPCTSLYIKENDQYQMIEAGSQLTILPQSQLEIRMIFDSNKTSYIGAIKKFIVIETDDPERPVVRVRLKGEIIKR